MRILIFHGYLLEGTGSNVYNARLTAALVGLGHEVHLLCQDRHPERHAFVDAVGSWDAGEPRVRALDRPLGGGSPDGRCTVYRPDIGGLLPVYVADRYAGVEAKTFSQCSDLEVVRYIEANVAAVREVCALVEPEIALANHLVMGPVILARGLGGQVPYAVKVHGSALEYTVKPEPERFLGFAREGIAGARAVLVGSKHTAASLWLALGDPTLRERTRLGPPGVDVELFAPREPPRARAGFQALVKRLSEAAATPARGASAGDEDELAREAPAGEDDAFARDDRAAGFALARVKPERDRLITFVGKLIFNKGIDLLLAAWPLVLARVPDAKLVVVGFGADRESLEQLLDALSRGELERAPNGALPHLRAFLTTLEGAERERYLAAARALPERVILTGRLDHDELAEILPMCEAMVVPSTFPEAFGMVAAEAAACGVLPISAAHSGLVEVSDALAGAVPGQVVPWLTFPVDDDAVGAIAERVVAWLMAEPALRARARNGLVATVRERWSWRGVAQAVIAAAQGELETLAEP